MRASFSQYLSLAKYLLVPSLMLGAFMLLAAFFILVFSASLEAHGAKGAFHVGGMALALLLSLAFLTVPPRMRVLLTSKAFLLCAPSVRALIIVAAFGLGVWITFVTMLALQDSSFMSVRMAVVFWAVSGVATLLVVVFPKVIYIVIWGVVVGVNQVEDLSFSGAESVFATNFSLSAVAAFVGVGSWFLLYKLSIFGHIASDAFSPRHLIGLIPDFSKPSKIQLSQSEFSRFLQATRNSSHPTFSDFCGGSLIAGGVILWWFLSDGEAFRLIIDEEISSIAVSFFVAPIVAIYFIAQSMSGKLRSFWLVLPGDRLRLARCIDRAPFVTVPVFFLPLALVLFGLWIFGVLVLLQVAQAIFISLVSIVLFYYWSFYVYGKDRIWSGIGSLVLVIVLTILYGESFSGTPFHPAVLGCLSLVIVFCLFLRFKVYQRWARIDFTELRSSWPL